MKKLMDYVAEAAKVVEEVMPWDLEEELKGGATPLILDIFANHMSLTVCT